MFEEYWKIFNTTWPRWMDTLFITYFIVVSTVLYLLWQIARFKARDSKDKYIEGYDKLISDDKLSNNEEWTLYTHFDQKLMIKWIGPVIIAWIGIPAIRMIFINLFKN